MTRTNSERPWVSIRRVALAVTLAATQLVGCAPLLVGGAMVGGTMMVSDRRTTGTLVEDQAIELKANNRLKEVINDRSHVNVTSYNRTRSHTSIQQYGISVMHSCMVHHV